MRRKKGGSQKEERGISKRRAAVEGLRRDRSGKLDTPGKPSSHAPVARDPQESKKGLKSQRRVRYIG